MRSENRGLTTSPLNRPTAAPALSRRLWPFFGASAVTAIALLLALFVKTYLFVGNVALVFVAGIVLCATRWGLLPALFACALSTLALSFFVFPPIHDLAVEDPENVVAGMIFVGVAIFVGRLTAQARVDAMLADSRAKVTEELYAFARKLTSVDDLDELLRTAARQIASSVDVSTVLLLADQQVLAIRAAVPPLDDLEPNDFALADWTLKNDQGNASAGGGEPELKFSFLPLRSAGETVGVVGISRRGHPPQLSDDERRFVEAITDQVAVAVKRLKLADEVERARVTAETESLRSAMLSAISHDLKTPLASILGAATSLSSYNSYFEQQERDELVATIREEAERMSRFIANLLDITRVESGTLEVQSEATDIEEVVGAVVRRARRVLGSRRLQIRVAPDLPMLDLDGVLLEQTLFNLLDNAAKYAPQQSTIVIDARRVNDRIIIKVMDEGPGISPQERTRIFEKFYRSGQSGRQRAGTGLGLAICRGFVEAMGGRIIAGNRTDRRGAVFLIGFPLPKLATVRHPPDLEDD